MANPIDFLSLLKNFDKDNVPRSKLAQLRKYTKEESFNVQNMNKKSEAAAGLAGWVLAIEKYCIEREQSDGKSPVRLFKEAPPKYAPKRSPKMRASKSASMKKPKATAAPPSQPENFIFEVDPNFKGICAADINEIKVMRIHPDSFAPILEATCILLNKKDIHDLFKGNLVEQIK